MLQHIQKFKPFLVITLFIIILLSGTTVQTQAKSNFVGSGVIADIAEVSSPKVVWIATTYANKENSKTIDPKRLFEEPDQKATPEKGLGSGFFYNEDGYILTNAHVVAEATEIEVILQDRKDPIPAKLIGLDQELDVAIIKVDLTTKTNYLKFGNSDQLRIGEWVVAIGNPYGLDHSVTIGIISAKGRPLTVGQTNAKFYENMLQTDAAINPGNSGGPLLNLAGEVIGINTAVSKTGQGLGFAIPINAVQYILTELMTNGKISRPWLGVFLTDLKNLDANTLNYLGIKEIEGVIIKQVIKNSPGAGAGLKNYDLVTEIDHQTITTADEFVKTIRNKKVGDKLKLLVIRNGNPIVIDITLGEKP